MNRHLEVEEFTPRTFVTSGDEVIVLVTNACDPDRRPCLRVPLGSRVRGAGRPIAGFREYTDTATIAEALAASVVS